MVDWALKNNNLFINRAATFKNTILLFAFCFCFFWSIPDSQVFNQSQTLHGLVSDAIRPFSISAAVSFEFFSLPFYFRLCLFWSFVPFSWSSYPSCPLSARAFVFSCLFVCKVLKKEKKEKKEKEKKSL